MVHYVLMAAIFIFTSIANLKRENTGDMLLIYLSCIFLSINVWGGGLFI